MSTNDRALAIETAAYSVLLERGVKGTSMLAVAREAKASNETLYKWYGDKFGLFSAMVRRNSDTVSTRLTDLENSGEADLKALQTVGETLLEMLISERAIALNRAAAADVTGALGHEIAKGGQDAIMPMLAKLIVNIQNTGALGPADPPEVTDIFLRLLIGNLQVRRVISVIAPLRTNEITARTRRAVEMLEALFPKNQRSEA